MSKDMAGGDGGDDERRRRRSGASAATSAYNDMLPGTLADAVTGARRPRASPTTSALKMRSGS